MVKRQIATNVCLGGVEGSLPNLYYFCTFNDNDTTAYAVGDSVVLEQYTGNNLTDTLSGFISYIDPGAGKAYFVADEKKVEGTIKDYSALTNDLTRKVANDSVVSFPSARYGATFALQPTFTTKASYWEGAATNVNYNHRFADLWNVQFATALGELSTLWSMPTTDNTVDPNFANSTYNFQVVRPNYSYQISTSNNSPGGANPAVVKDKSYTDQHGNNYPVWDSTKRWLMDIDPNDAGKVVIGAWVTLERRLENGTRETFHGIVESLYSDPPPECGAYSDSKLCLRHNPSYPNDSGFAADSKNVKITMIPSFSTSTISGGTFSGFGDRVSLQNVPDAKLGTIPGVGATVLIWKNGIFPSPTSAYTFIIKSRTVPSGSNFNLYFDKLTASPQSSGFSTSQIASDGTTDRLVTITDHQLVYDYPNAPEWIKNVTGESWKIRVANKNSGLLYRPASRRGGMTASLYDPVSKVSKVFAVGGTFGRYGSLWKEESAGLTSGAALKWVPQYVSEKSSEDIPNLFGGSLVVYKSGSSIRAVYFGGKQKTDASSADYGNTIGAKMLGRPDNGTFIDNSFYVIDNPVSNDQTAVSLTNTIEVNKSSAWPSGSVVDNSLMFKGGGRDDKNVCAYIGQVGCTSKQLLSQLGNLGRMDDSPTNDQYNGWSWGRTAILNSLGHRFKSQGATPKASLIMSLSTLSGIGVNSRWEQDGYQPYLKDDTGSTDVYGSLSNNFNSDKTIGLVAYSAINNQNEKGGAILATSVGVGNAIANNRGGVTGTAGGWYSYCAKSDTTVDGNGVYTCNSDATRYLPTLPDPEDLLFLLNAAQALGATDTYKVVGYYGGIKRGYLVTSVSGTLPKVYEIVP